MQEIAFMYTRAPSTHSPLPFPHPRVTFDFHQRLVCTVECCYQQSQQRPALLVAGCHPPRTLLGQPGGGQGGCAHSCGHQLEEEEAGPV